VGGRLKLFVPESYLHHHYNSLLSLHGFLCFSDPLALKRIGVHKHKQTPEVYIPDTRPAGKVATITRRRAIIVFLGVFLAVVRRAVEEGGRDAAMRAGTRRVDFVVLESRSTSAWHRQKVTC
jgi:hypothetical protein